MAPSDSFAMMMKKRTANKPFRFTLATIGFLLALSLVFLLFFAYYTSPLSVDVGYDAAFFRRVGQGMRTLVQDLLLIRHVTHPLSLREPRWLPEPLRASG